MIKAWIVTSLYMAIALLSACNREEGIITCESLIREMTDRQSLARYPDKPFKHKQFSSYNRASVSPLEDGWFANQDMSHFLRVEVNGGRREFVLFDAEGPGAVVRWWMTFYRARHGTIRIYIDRDTLPVIGGSPDDLLSGEILAGAPLAISLQKGAPLGEVGRDYDHNLYVPIPFEKQCKITYESDSIVTRYDYEGTPVPQGYFWPDVFYNIGFRLYDPDVKVESFSLRALEKVRPLLSEAGMALLADQVACRREWSFQKLLLPGDSVTLDINRARSAINRLRIHLDAVEMNQALRSTVLCLAFDGHQTVWVPVGEFFGSGYTLQTHKTWMNSSDGRGGLESFRVMPFRETCTISLVNFGDQEVSVSGSAGTEVFDWTPGSMYFAASWHEAYQIPSRDSSGSPFDMNFVTISGKGVYVGDQVTLFNSTYHWWGEGDEKIFVDGESFPSSFGTGSEDYYGYSFARQEAFSHPFLAQPTGTGNMQAGVTVNTRHRSLDAIPFHSAISANIELWHWANVRVNYALTSFYYVTLPYRVNIKSDIEAVRRPVALGLSGGNPAYHYSAGDFKTIPKIDAHFHYLSTDDRYMKLAKSLNIKLLTPIWDGEEVSIADQTALSESVYRAFPGWYAFFGTFPVDSFDHPGFAGRTIAHIDRCLQEGASGIKIWKNIGMVLKDRSGKFVMIDDPAFGPVFKYLEEKNIPVIAHLGEPRNCWLPLDRMNNEGDASYYRENPQYHMYLHPEVPSYEEQIAARDRILSRHPSLRLVGAHLGSLEWSVDELARRFDAYPEFRADVSARIFHLQLQSGKDYAKVRNFMIRYQDRLLYGTDQEVHDVPGITFEQTSAGLENGWYRQWLYFATDSVVGGIRGLNLPAVVIDKLYYRNAEIFFRRH